MAEQPFLFSDGPWIRIRDGNPTGLSIFKRHYSAKRKPDMQAQFVGPGESVVLLTPDARALFVWRKERYRLDTQLGVNCAVFRNEGSNAGRASDLIEAAVLEAWQRWPGERLFTFVDPSKIRHKRDPGRCFLKAGFKLCGVSQKGLLIFERLADKDFPRAQPSTEIHRQYDPNQKHLFRSH
jgi:hypothetical protein